MNLFRTAVVAALLAAPVFSGVVIRGQDAPTYQERDFLSRVRRLTVDGKRAGEGYWSPDGTRLVFQSEREPGNPFYQIYVLDLASGDTSASRPAPARPPAFLPSGHRRDQFASTRRSEIEAVSGRRARLPRFGQGAPLLVGLRPRDGHLQLQEKTGVSAHHREEGTTRKAATPDGKLTSSMRSGTTTR
jgi:hypothetical protein